MTSVTCTEQSITTLKNALVSPFFQTVVLTS